VILPGDTLKKLISTKGGVRFPFFYVNKKLLRFNRRDAQAQSFITCYAFGKEKFKDFLCVSAPLR
jgi:hypothetical protein